jgi:leucyl aminopeptidase
MLTSTRIALLAAFGLGLAPVALTQSEAQKVLGAHAHHVDPNILSAIEAHSDPVDAFVALNPESMDILSERRLLRIPGNPTPKWLTEGDKMRLRRQGQKFIDITDYQESIHQVMSASSSQKPHLPELSHQRYVKPLFSKISTKRMHDVLRHMTSYYTRYFGSTEGEQSSQWLYNHIAEIIRDAPFHTHISLEFFTHPFPQSSIIARFEPKIRNFSAPVTILGAHQDSMNYLFPLLPAPGADDDCSGTVTILEAFRVLAESGFTPKDGPVEFHWNAAEEGGNLGSQAIAHYYKDAGAHVGAMMEFDMTAFVARNATESISFIITDSDKNLTNWAIGVVDEYLTIPALVNELPSGAGSDYMSWTQFGYPATFATEGDPLRGGFPGDFDPYIHGVKDTMDVDDERGHFSLDHMARFAELAIAFAVEQAGWDNKWR